MAGPISVNEAALEVQAAKREIEDATREAQRLELEMYNSERRRDLAMIRLEEANRVLLEAASA